MKQKNKKTWKRFLGFQAKRKKKKVDSPRTVLLDVNCMERDGDTSYEISFLSDDMNVQNMAPKKLNRSTSFGSFINLRRTKSKLAQLNSSKSFDTFEKERNLFDDYYKNEEFELRNKASCKSPKFSIVSLRNKSLDTSMIKTDLGYDADVFDDIDLKELDRTEEKQATSKKEEDFFANNHVDEVHMNLTTDTSEVLDEINIGEPTIDETENKPSSNLDNMKTKIKGNISEEPKEETKMEANIVDNEDIRVESLSESKEKVQEPHEESNSFFSRMACEPLSEIFACATNLSKFESMLFGDDLLPSCGGTFKQCYNGNINNDIDTNEANISPNLYDPTVPIDKPHDRDNPYELVDTFLNQVTQRGIPLTFFHANDEDENEWEAHKVTLYVTPGRRDEHVFVAPQILWVAQNNGGDGAISPSTQTKVYHHFDLTDVNAILKPEESFDNEVIVELDDSGMQEICFSMISNDGNVYIFEASDVEERNYVVDSLQLVISRLAFV